MEVKDLFAAIEFLFVERSDELILYYRLNLLTFN